MSPVEPHQGPGRPDSTPSPQDPGPGDAPARHGAGPRVLVLSGNYPSPTFPNLGIWVQRLVQASTWCADPEVITPVPYTPPGIPLAQATRYRRIPRRARDGNVAVHYPRVAHGHLQGLSHLRARLAYPTVRRLADRLHRHQPFKLIHAHFVFPEGVMAARLGQRYGIPVVTTEHANWLPWLEDQPAVRRQVLQALPGIRLVTAVSPANAATVRAVAGSAARVQLLPNVVDETIFSPAAGEGNWHPDHLLFVGNVRRAKGLDILVRAMTMVAARRPAIQLHVIGDALFRAYSKEEVRVKELAQSLGVARRIHFLGPLPPLEVARRMRASAALVLPSRRESFATVVIEALACGTPVVATRCGGPDDLVNDSSGRMAPVEDPEALALAILDVLDRRSTFDAKRLRDDTVQRFGLAAARRNLHEIYTDLIAG